MIKGNKRFEHVTDCKTVTAHKHTHSHMHTHIELPTKFSIKQRLKANSKWGLLNPPRQSGLQRSTASYWTPGNFFISWWSFWHGLSAFAQGGSEYSVV